MACLLIFCHKSDNGNLGPGLWQTQNSGDVKLDTNPSPLDRVVCWQIYAHQHDYIERFRVSISQRERSILRKYIISKFPIAFSRLSIHVTLTMSEFHRLCPIFRTNYLFQYYNNTQRDKLFEMFHIYLQWKFGIDQLYETAPIIWNITSGNEQNFRYMMRWRLHEIYHLERGNKFCFQTGKYFPTTRRFLYKKYMFKGFKTYCFWYTILSLLTVKNLLRSMNKDIGRKAEDTKRENTKITQIQKQIIMNVKNTENKRKVS